MRTLALIAGLLLSTAGPNLAQQIVGSDHDTAGEPLGAAPGDATPDLTGAWVLNERLSDPFVPPAGTGEGRDGPRGGMGGDPGRGRGGMDGGMGDDEGPSEDEMEQRRAEMKKQMEEMKTRMARITIFLEGLEFNVTDGRDISHLLYTDGREMTIWTDLGQATASAAWEGPVLVTRWRMGKDRPENVRRFSLEPGTGRMIVRESIGAPGKSKSSTRTMVYDRAN